MLIRTWLQSGRWTQFTDVHIELTWVHMCTWEEKSMLCFFSFRGFPIYLSVGGGCWSHLLCTGTKFTFFLFGCSSAHCAWLSPLRNKGPVVCLWGINASAHLLDVEGREGEGGGVHGGQGSGWLCGVAWSNPPPFSMQISSDSMAITPWGLPVCVCVWEIGASPGWGWEVRFFTEDKQAQWPERDEEVLTHNMRINTAELFVAYFSTSIEHIVTEQTCNGSLVQRRCCQTIHKACYTTFWLLIKVCYSFMMWRVRWPTSAPERARKPSVQHKTSISPIIHWNKFTTTASTWHTEPIYMSILLFSVLLNI